MKSGMTGYLTRGGVGGLGRPLLKEVRATIGHGLFFTTR
jgi:hypothetical protein